jgi:hypothetical protein
MPESPKTGESYKIFIIVKLPPGGGVNYQKEDLSIEVIGSDGYKKYFPSSINSEDAQFQDEFKVGGDQAVVVMPIPGGATNVKDIISAKSSLLNENQTLSLVFKEAATEQAPQPNPPTIFGKK